ncbi:MAG: hypothetical protein ACR2GH_02610 [Pseudonocardia sp.]
MRPPGRQSRRWASNRGLLIGAGLSWSDGGYTATTTDRLPQVIGTSGPPFEANYALTLQLVGRPNYSYVLLDESEPEIIGDIARTEDRPVGLVRRTWRRFW